MIKKIKKEQLLTGVLLGVLLLVLVIPVPKEKGEEEMEVSVSSGDHEKIGTDSVETQLKEILQKISGVGQTEVFITYRDKGKVIVEKDETVSEELVEEADSSGGTRTTNTRCNEKQTVYGTGEIPYVVQELSPTVEGVLIVAQGAGNDVVKKQIQDTIVALFGLDTHKISIMKMEGSK